MQKRLKIFLYIGFLFLLFPKTSHAYLDPGTGSYLFQILIAGFLGSLFFVRSAIKKIKETWKNLIMRKTIPKSDEIE